MPINAMNACFMALTWPGGTAAGRRCGDPLSADGIRAPWPRTGIAALVTFAQQDGRRRRRHPGVLLHEVTPSEAAVYVRSLTVGNFCLHPQCAVSAQLSQHSMPHREFGLRLAGSSRPRPCCRPCQFLMPLIAWCSKLLVRMLPGTVRSAGTKWLQPCNQSTRALQRRLAEAHPTWRLMLDQHAYATGPAIPQRPSLVRC